MGRIWASAFTGAILLAACGKGSGSDGFEGPGDEGDASVAFDAGSANPNNCAPGDTVPCSCLDGTAGTKPCGVNGAFGTCSCTEKPLDAGPAVCGDHKCTATAESCVSCPSDCGECAKCNLAPSCSNGLALPSQTQDVKFDDLSTPAPDPQNDAGATIKSTCEDAQLRLRISRIEVGHQAKEVYLPTGTLSGSPQSYYCVVQASDGVVVSNADAGSNGTVEVALTKPTAKIPDNQGADFAPTDSIFWGQSGPRLTHNNLTITYSCFQQKDPGSSTWSNVLTAAGNAAGSLAGAGPYGWAFGLGSIGLQVAAAAVAAANNNGDWHMFDVTQTIDSSRLLDLTNGRVWSFNKNGGNQAFQYPWSITVYVESWGCAEALPGTTN